MRKIILGLVAIVCAITAHAQNTDLLVEVPKVPENITRLDERCNYIVSKYWERCNIKSAFSSLHRLDATLGQFLDFTPYATADTVHMAIDNLIKSVEKTGAENVLKLGRLAEKWTYADSAEYLSEELYYPFCEAVAKNKKIKGAEKARFEAQYKQLTNSRAGVQNPMLQFTRPDGTVGTLADITAPHVLLFFMDPECSDCRLAKIRLNADYAIDALVKNNILAIVAIYPGENDDAWKEYAAELPAEWSVGYWPEAETYFTMDSTPMLYYLDPDRIIKVKNIAVDNVLTAFKQFLN
jgi:hypothetical protein